MCVRTERGHAVNVCRAHRERPQDCAAKPIDPALVDQAVIDNLGRFLGDVARWKDRLTQGHAAERARLESEVERADIALAEEVRRVGLLTNEWERWLTAGDPQRADAVLEALARR